MIRTYFALTTGDSRLIAIGEERKDVLASVSEKNIDPNNLEWAVIHSRMPMSEIRTRHIELSGEYLNIDGVKHTVYWASSWFPS